MRSHLKTTQITMGITLLLDTDRVLNHKTMVSLSRAAGASISSIKSLHYHSIMSRSIGVSYKLGKMGNLIPNVREIILPPIKHLKENYVRKLDFLNDLNVGIEIGEKKLYSRFYKQLVGMRVENSKYQGVSI